MAEYKVLYWHGIPTQVRAEDENGRTGVQLPERFQLAIDEAAMAAHLIDEDDYLEGFRWSELM
ncbi:MAG: virulence factor, partial [Anaerolineales bacterium]